MKSFVVETSNEEASNITSLVDKLIDINSGICLVFVAHTSCGITINETDNLEFDMPKFFNELVPNSREFVHEGGVGNADAHIKASIVGNSVTIPIENNQLVLGTWQKILLLEFDGPRSRKVVVQCVGDKDD